MKKMIEICKDGIPAILGHGPMVSLQKVFPVYSGKGIYKIAGEPGLWYIRAASFGWGYIATPA